MKANRIFKRLVIFSIAAFLCFGSVSIVFATTFTGTPSPALDPIFGTLIDFDDQATGTLVDEFDYVDHGIASIVETEGLGTFARYGGTQSLPNYIGTGILGERGTDANLGWDGTILIELIYPTNKIGIGVANNQGGPEILTIYDSTMTILETQTVPTGGNVYCGFERTDWDIMYLEITGDYFAIDDLQFNRLSIDVMKEIVDGDEFVPVFTDVSWDLEITVTNNGDVDLDEIWIYDGIGAKLDLVIQNEDDGDPNNDYIFDLDGTGPLYFNDAEDDAYFGETGPVMWALSNGKEPKNNGKHSATNIVWDVGDLDEGDSKQLWFSVHTIAFQTGKGNKNDKQAFTSTCHHELNDGVIAIDLFEGDYYDFWSDPVIVSVYYTYAQDPAADSDLDGLYDWEEVTAEYGHITDPCNWDTDGDGYSDGEEIAAENDPTDPEDHPIPPVAEFTFDPTDPEESETINFDGSTSSDADGTIISWEWDFESDETYDATGETTIYSYTTAGTYDATLKVTDDDGYTDTVTYSITVTAIVPP